jgi:hypothetical protein
MAEIIPLNKAPSKSQAQLIIRRLADEGKVVFSVHCKMRKRERCITTVQIMNCLKKGVVIEDPHLTYDYKGWMTAVGGNVAGRSIKVVIVLRWQQDILTVTVYQK